MTKLILIGGGGHCLSTIGVIESIEGYEIAGILDSVKPIGEKVLSYPVVGTDADIPYWVEQGALFVNTLGQIGSPVLRKKVFDLVKEHGGVFSCIGCLNSVGVSLCENGRRYGYLS